MIHVSAYSAHDLFRNASHFVWRLAIIRDREFGGVEIIHYQKGFRSDMVRDDFLSH